MTTAPKAARRFDVGLSYPGEHRPFVQEVAERLAATLSQDRVLYDKFHDVEFARPNLSIFLPRLYREQSELIVAFLCPEYAAKRWCQLEWRHISQLIASLEADRIMFLSFGDPGDLSELGVLPGDGFIDIISLAPETVADKVLKRLRLNQGRVARQHLTNPQRFRPSPSRSPFTRRPKPSCACGPTSTAAGSAFSTSPPGPTRRPSTPFLSGTSLARIQQMQPFDSGEARLLTMRRPRGRRQARPSFATHVSSCRLGSAARSRIR